MKKLLLFSCAAIFITSILTGCSKDEKSSTPQPLCATCPIVFPDANFENVVRTLLGIALPAPVTPNDMATITDLQAHDKDISSIEGVQYCVNIQTLNLMYNFVSDIGPVERLTTLTNLVISGNPVPDLAPLSGLTGLTKLAIGDFSGDTPLTDISPLAGLTNLTSLYLSYSGVTSIAALSGMTKLIELTLYSNNITDISPLAGKTTLTWLNLGNNNISNIVAIGGLRNLEWLGLHSNQLTTNIHALVMNAISSGLGPGDEVRLQGNALSGAALDDIETLTDTYHVTVCYPDDCP